MTKVKAKRVRLEETAFFGNKQELPHSEHVSSALHNAAYYMGKAIKKAPSAAHAKAMGEKVWHLHKASKLAEKRHPSDMGKAHAYVMQHDLAPHVHQHGYMSKVEKRHFDSFHQGQSHSFKT